MSVVDLTEAEAGSTEAVVGLTEAEEVPTEAEEGPIEGEQTVHLVTAKTRMSDGMAGTEVGHQMSGAEVASLVIREATASLRRSPLIVGAGLVGVAIEEDELAGLTRQNPLIAKQAQTVILVTTETVPVVGTIEEVVVAEGDLAEADIPTEIPGVETEIRAALIGIPGVREVGEVTPGVDEGT